MGALSKVLVANRGEIARRVFRTCRRLGISTVAVYSDADEKALFVNEADEAVRLGGPLAADSYLNIDQILQAARKTGADSIHPGYGFLSENAEFAQRCEDVGLTFIGPSANSIRQIGSKRGAKLLLRAKEPSVPLIPGYDGEDQSGPTLLKEADRIGYPVLLKASAGGGGKGMRVVTRREDLLDAIDGAKTEARNSFGDESLLLERYFTSVRHVEVQVFGDREGNAAHFYERECSVQRRHQKIIEESPSPVMTSDLRQRMGEAAVKVARLIGYRNAGTVEFVVTDDKSFYFLEVNTRLQVEHPVTEAITGLDLVELQIRLAEGQTLKQLKLLPSSFGEPAVPSHGHAIEVRLYAEDPCNSFFPSTGTLHLWHAPQLSGVRFDSAVATGSEVSVYYDPLLCKVIAHAPTRSASIALMLRALAETIALGVTTNKTFLQQVLQHEAFAAGRLTTAFIDTYLPPTSRAKVASAGASISVVAALLADWSDREARRSLLRHVPSHFRTNPYNWAVQTLALRHPAQTYKIQYNLERAPGAVLTLPIAFQLRVNDSASADTAVLHGTKIGDGTATCIDVTVAGVRRKLRVVRVPGLAPNNEEDTLLIGSPLGDYAFTLVSRFGRKSAAASDLSEERVYTAPMPAKIYKLLVKDGQTVTKGTPLLVLESMKMETKVYALQDGVVSQLSVREGQLVTAGLLLLEIR